MARSRRASRGKSRAVYHRVRHTRKAGSMWGERSEGVSPPGVPLKERVSLPGIPVIENGYLVPSDAPGFGFEFTQAWLEERAEA